MKAGIRSQVVEDMYAVPENYLEIEGEQTEVQHWMRASG